MKVSIKTLSEVTGFSQATVSNALNNKRNVNKETAERILAAARSYGYLPEPKVKSIKLVVFRNSGKILSDSPFFAELIQGIEAESKKHGMETILCNLNKDAADYESMKNQLLSDPNTAILLLGTEMGLEDAKDFACAKSPVVMMDSWFGKLHFDSVLVNNTDAVGNEVDYLVEKGHRNIGYLKSRERTTTFEYRQMGYERALSQNGIEINPSYIFGLTPTMDGACEDLMDILDGKPELPTAFFADDDIIALGAMKAFQKQGYRIPQDVSIVGFDDIPFCKVASPPLTTVHVFKQEMGKIAVQRLLDVLKNGNEIKTQLQICCEFVERESVMDLRNL